MVEKYYEEELQYLHESGRRFARAHPDRAALLDIDAVGDRDPSVERLFEGFAFLTARVRQQLDDSFPQLTEGLVDLMWPGLLHEIPSCCIVEFTPRQGLLSGSRTIARGAEVLSKPVGPGATVCRFTTTREVVLNPISVAAVEQTMDTRGMTTFAVRFRCHADLPANHLSPRPLRLHLHAELPTALAMRELLTSRMVHSEMVVNDGAEGVVVPVQGPITPSGLTDSEAILPDTPTGMAAHNLLLEYFAYPEKFLFVDVHGLDLARLGDTPVRCMTWRVTVDGALPPSRPLDAGTFRLHCSPAVNLFAHQCEPVMCDGTKSEYALVADRAAPDTVRVHSVRSVSGTDRASGERTEYEPVHAYNSLGRGTTRRFAARRRETGDGSYETVLAVGGPYQKDGHIREESLAIEAWCTNASVPREGLREEAVNRPGRDLPDWVMVSNITRPTLPVPAPPDTEFLWRFLGHMGATQSSLGSADRLRALLRVYDRGANGTQSRHIDAISDVTVEPTDTIVRNCLARGTRVTISLDEAHFADSATVRLFGDVLREFLRQYASVNSATTLVIVMKPSGKTHRWEAAGGARWPL